MLSIRSCKQWNPPSDRLRHRTQCLEHLKLLVLKFLLRHLADRTGRYLAFNDFGLFAFLPAGCMSFSDGWTGTFSGLQISAPGHAPDCETPSTAEYVAGSTLAFHICWNVLPARVPNPVIMAWSSVTDCRMLGKSSSIVRGSPLGPSRTDSRFLQHARAQGMVGLHLTLCADDLEIFWLMHFFPTTLLIPRVCQTYIGGSRFSLQTFFYSLLLPYLTCYIPGCDEQFSNLVSGSSRHAIFVWPLDENIRERPGCINDLF